MSILDGREPIVPRPERLSTVVTQGCEKAFVLAELRSLAGPMYEQRLWGSTPLVLQIMQTCLRLRAISSRHNSVRLTALHVVGLYVVSSEWP